MNWQVVVRPEAGSDVIEAAHWYDSQRAGLGDQFVSEIFGVFDALAPEPSPPLSPPSHQKYPLALSRAVPLSRYLRSDRRSQACSHCRCPSRRSTRPDLAKVYLMLTVERKIGRRGEFRIVNFWDCDLRIGLLERWRWLTIHQVAIESV